MRFELGHGRCCISQLRRGEAKRVPKNLLVKPVGYYVGCPGCGFPQVITTREVDDKLGQDVAEDALMGAVSIGPGYACDRCGVRFRVEAGEIVFL